MACNVHMIKVIKLLQERVQISNVLGASLDYVSTFFYLAWRRKYES